MRNLQSIAPIIIIAIDIMSTSENFNRVITLEHDGKLVIKIASTNVHNRPKNPSKNIASFLLLVPNPAEPAKNVQNGFTALFDSRSNAAWIVFLIEH